MPSSDREIFERFLGDPDRSREEALLAYAGYSAEKYDWIAHAETRDGKPPSDEEVARWIRDLSDARLKAIEDQAVTAFDVAARTYMQPVIEKANREAVDASVLAEVKHATSFRSTFWPNLFIGVVSSFVFALLVLGAAWIADKDPSMIGLGKRFEAPIAAPNGQGR